jgi:uncharacterized protein YjbI with pentapeptide repeats
MSFEILHRYTQCVLYKSETADTIAAAVIKAVSNRASLNGANLNRASLDRASLDGASLDGASLDGASLDGASLYRASLNGANLNGASLYGASLYGASLDGASLNGANLYGASLYGANLYGAKLSETTVMPNGETWKKYLSEVMPALLVAGGLTMAQVCDPAHWNCHDWNNCPMAAAFGVESEDQTPALLRPRVREFVQLFDAKLIPNPITGELPQ